ncbi:MAG: SLC13 family permease [Bradymonadaceae bacterium]
MEWEWFRTTFELLRANWQLVTVAVVTLAAVAAFIAELLEIELIAMSVLVVLLVTGIVSPAQGLKGFSSEATITIAAMFVLSEGLRQTGLVNRLGDVLATVFTDYDLRLALTGMMVLTGTLSAFINNTAVVAIFLPVVLNTARQTDIPATKALMALSFSAMFGGMCTLIGTSTNILVSSIIAEHEMAAIGMFEMAPVGIVCFVAGALYLLTLGDQIIPEREGRCELTETYEMGDYLTEVEIAPPRGQTYRPVGRSYILEEDDIDILEVVRHGEPLRPGDVSLNLEPGDRVRIRGSAEAIRRLTDRKDIRLRPGAPVGTSEITGGEAELFEAVVAPDSMLDGSTLNDVDFDEMFGAKPLAIRRQRELTHRDLRNVELRGGDVLLLQAPEGRMNQLQEHTAFVVLSELGLPDFRTEMIPTALAIIVGVVALAALDLVPIVVSALLGALTMTFLGILRPEDAYKAINWQVILLLAGLIPLGIALENTGGIALISELLIDVAGGYGPYVMLATFYLITVLLTGIMSNQATAILFTPLAIESAQATGYDPRPFVFAVTFAASASFLTPVGYQTNTLIYGAGQFEFKDFMTAGTPLTLLFWGLVTLLIPVIWPL